MSELNLQQQLRAILSPKLYAHCAGVAQTAADLAVLLGCDCQKARLAGWLHDCAREWPAEKLFAFAAHNHIAVDRYTQRAPVILHAPVGAVVAKKWGITDREILAAIRKHTLGEPEMTTLEQLVYLADKIEPHRSYPGVEALRDLAQQNFQQALIQASANSISYLLEKRQLVHPQALAFWNWLVS
ncbi:MAG TPA: bis(5'-nucleosyl)-tetraphosphatase (symmetrical) YqeK [Oscillospiraceae bacterium]|nr:bis(5'-nucleosyl)-tetraphosphatase (symmetrical) YqeK [Oscillospiraceae bacterium]